MKIGLNRTDRMVGTWSVSTDTDPFLLCCDILLGLWISSGPRGNVNMNSINP